MWVCATLNKNDSEECEDASLLLHEALAKCQEDKNKCDKDELAELLKLFTPNDD